MASKVKVVLKHRSMDKRAGDVIEVEKDHAEYLIANGNAVSLKGAEKQLEQDIRES